MALVGVLSLTLAAAPLPAMAEEGGSASDENATQTVTVYHFEMVYYDDPTFEDWGVPELTGLRLIGTSTVEGLKPGDVVRAWDQVGTHPGFAFFDGWPRELTVSEDPSENAIQMNYIRQSSEVTVNYYEASLLDNMAAMPLYGNTIVENVGDHMVEFTKMGSEVLDRGLYAEVLTGDELAEETDMVDGLAYAGSYPDDVFVSMDTSKNEINLVYTRPTVRPDDVEVGADVADVPDEVAPPAPDDAPEGPVTGDGDGDAAPDDSAGDKEPAGTPEEDAASESGANSDTQVVEGSSDDEAARAEAQAAAAHDLAPKKSRFDIVKHYPQVDTIDHSLALTLEEYKTERKRLQDRLFRLENIMFQRRVPLILMYEGWDAAGKGGNIKRVAQALDARAYTIFPSPAPTKPELAHPFLWRYWTRLPKAGHVGMYDRSWYGRVLVERVEGFATPAEWSRAYDEINEFEHDLVDWGAILLKFWVDVSPEEQLRRFQDREDDPAKQWKITEDDWRNREKYPQYKAAIDDMFRLTSTTFAPWVVLESDDKRYARIKALRIIVEALEKRLGECPAS